MMNYKNKKLSKYKISTKLKINCPKDLKLKWFKKIKR